MNEVNSIEVERTQREMSLCLVQSDSRRDTKRGQGSQCSSQS